ncbi:hypothetical protein Tco_0818272 [Tanacetum coccineum]
MCAHPTTIIQQNYHQIGVGNFDGASLLTKDYIPRNIKGYLKKEEIGIHDSYMIWLHYIRGRRWGWKEAKNFVTFSFFENNEDVEVKECGVRLIYDEDSQQDVTMLSMLQDLPTPSQLGGAMTLGMIVLYRKLFQVVPDDFKHMWHEWALRGLISFSLVSHITLSLLGNVRKYNPRTRVRMALCFAYLLALAVASQALGVITRITLDFAVALYILLLSWPRFSALPKLSVLVYLAGSIKCFERIKALLMKKSQGLYVNVEEVAKLSLTVNNHLYPEEDSSQSYFRHPKSTNAFCVVEIELGFAFDML